MKNMVLYHGEICKILQIDLKYPRDLTIRSIESGSVFVVNSRIVHWIE